MIMQVKRFVAADMRRALELVRQNLGPEAIILSSNRIPEGVELLTTMGTDTELQQIQQQSFETMGLAPLLSDGPQSSAPKFLQPDQEKSLPSTALEHPHAGKTGMQLADDIEQARQRMIAKRKAEASAQDFLVGKNTRVNAAIPRQAPKAEANNLNKNTDIRVNAKSAGANVGARVLTAAEKYPLEDDVLLAPKAQSLPLPKAAEPSFKEMLLRDLSPAVDSSAQLSELQAEIADMRYLLEQQLDRLSGQPIKHSGSPILASVSRRLERLGLPQDVVSQVVESCKKTSSLTEAWPDALANLAHQLPINSRDIVNQGGVFAFVGPTGVGKTTTIGKLAARYVLEHGADKVALITTDTYRIAAHDQLRSLARILRVPVRVVDESNSLEGVLRSLAHCTLVLIDTAGFRQGDPFLKAQLDALAAEPKIKTFLVMSCNSQAQMLKASVHAYGAARLQGCILTKLDETASMGEALGVALHNRLAIAYTTDGQDIPKNLEVARAHQLVSKAVALLKSNPLTAVG
jgi:flagellar biosynthesis protein FlhF